MRIDVHAALKYKMKASRARYTVVQGTLPVPSTEPLVHYVEPTVLEPSL